MKKICMVVGKDYLNNRLFDITNTQLNRDDCLRAFYLLKEEFKKHDYELSTQDLISPSVADLVLYNEMPKPFPSNIVPEKSYLLIFETDIIRPDNWDLKKHAHFKKIFTWNDQFVDHKKYFKFNFPNTLKKFSVEDKLRPNFMTLISGNKTSKHKLELYSERFSDIKWFENNHPEDFAYYGMGWDYGFNVWWQKVFRKLKILKYLPKNKSRCYRGIVKDKFSTLKEYQFAICYENGRDIPGYITEKIMDCFFAGCIPIYWGANNIADFIPRGIFIDRRDFKSVAELYLFLKNLSTDEVLKMQKGIFDFLNSEKVTPFTNEAFVKTVVDGLLDE
jgi:hypothetical protein